MSFCFYCCCLKVQVCQCGNALNRSNAHLLHSGFYVHMKTLFAKNVLDLITTDGSHAQSASHHPPQHYLKQLNNPILFEVSFSWFTCYIILIFYFHFWSGILSCLYFVLFTFLLNACLLSTSCARFSSLSWSVMSGYECCLGSECKVLKSDNFYDPV